MNLPNLSPHAFSRAFYRIPYHVASEWSGAPRRAAKRTSGFASLSPAIHRQHQRREILHCLAEGSAPHKNSRAIFEMKSGEPNEQH